MGKGSKERVVPLGKQAQRCLECYLTEVRPALASETDEDPALWLNSRGKRLSSISLEQMMRRHCLEAGISTKITPHSIRRACATHMLRHGAHPVQIQLLLGHGSLQSLSHYLRLTITELKATHARSAPGR